MLVHKGGNIKAFSYLDADSKFTNEKDWPHRYGYQKMVQMTPLITEDRRFLNSEKDDWLIELQQDLAFPLSGFFFRYSFIIFFETDE